VFLQVREDIHIGTFNDMKLKRDSLQFRIYQLVTALHEHSSKAVCDKPIHWPGDTAPITDLLFKCDEKTLKQLGKCKKSSTSQRLCHQQNGIMAYFNGDDTHSTSVGSRNTSKSRKSTLGDSMLNIVEDVESPTWTQQSGITASDEGMIFKKRKASSTTLAPLEKKQHISI
jgi:hypothetical protein